MPNQNKTLHPLRQNMLQRRLQEIEYLERQQARQDDFTSRLYGKKDYSKERENIQLEDKQDPQKNTDKSPYCNIYARNRLLNKGIYMEPDKNANQMIEAMDKKGSGWEKLPKKIDAQGNPTGKLDHQEAQRRAEAGGTVVATYHNPNNAEHGHIVLVNPETGMKRSGKWGGEVPSVDGYNTDTKQITEGGSLSEQFSRPREPHMDYYEYTGPKKRKGKRINV